MTRFYAELDSVGEPHPAIELGLHWVKERLPRHREPVVVHGDWRIGNIAVDEKGSSPSSTGSSRTSPTRWRISLAARPRLALRR